MRHIKRITIILFIIACIAFVGGKVHSSKKDVIAPVIQAKSDEIHIQAGSEEMDLLQGLTAEDNRDGNLTDEILIGKVSRFSEKGVCKVEYIVFDESNNAGRYERTVYFDDYTSPWFELTSPLMYKVNNKITFSDRLIAQDILAGNISDRIKFQSADINQKEVGTYYVTVSVKNEYGDAVQAEMPVNVVSDAEYSNQIQLSTYLAYVPVGGTIDPLSYISSAVDVNGAEVDWSRIWVSYQVDTTVPGCGQIRYDLSDEYGNTAVTFLTVIVTE